MSDVAFADKTAVGKTLDSALAVFDANVEVAWAARINLVLGMAIMSFLIARGGYSPILGGYFAMPNFS